MEKAVVGTLAAGFGKVCQTTHVGLPHMFGGLPIAVGGSWAPTFNRICCGSHMGAKSYQGKTSSQQLATTGLFSQSVTQENRAILRILDSGKNVEPVSQNHALTEGVHAKGASGSDGSVLDLGMSTSSTLVPELGRSTSCASSDRGFSYLQTPSVAHLVQADWQSRLMRLEQGYHDVSAENDSLRDSLQAAHKMNGDAKELNLRLTKEVQRARREESSATQHMKWLEEEVQRLRQKCQSLSKDLRTARRKATQQISTVDVPASQVNASTNVPELDAEASGSSQPREVFCSSADTDVPPSDTAIASMEDDDAEEVVMSHVRSADTCDTVAEEHRINSMADVCMCDSTLGRSSGDSSWGCSCHQVYSLPLLLAHRSINMSIARGAPGLEPALRPDASQHRPLVARSLQ